MQLFDNVLEYKLVRMKSKLRKGRTKTYRRRLDLVHVSDASPSVHDLVLVLSALQICGSFRRRDSIQEFFLHLIHHTPRLDSTRPNVRGKSQIIRLAPLRLSTLRVNYGLLHVRIPHALLGEEETGAQDDAGGAGCDEGGELAACAHATSGPYQGCRGAEGGQGGLEEFERRWGVRRTAATCFGTCNI